MHSQKTQLLPAPDPTPGRRVPACGRSHRRFPSVSGNNGTPASTALIPDRAEPIRYPPGDDPGPDSQPAITQVKSAACATVRPLDTSALFPVNTFVLQRNFCIDHGLGHRSSMGICVKSTGFQGGLIGLTNRTSGGDLQHLRDPLFGRLLVFDARLLARCFSSSGSHLPAGDPLRPSSSGSYR